MNRSILRLSVVLMGLFALLIAFTTRWAVIEASELNERGDNRRPLIAEQQVPRGDIRSVDGELVATSRRQGGVFTREYPLGELFGNPIGYSFAAVGRTGVEASENAVLTGEENEFASIIEQLRGSPRRGSQLTVTLSAQAQRLALSQLGGRRGSVVALEPATGAVRVMASTPSFDPNLVRDRAQFEALGQAPDSPMFNRATQANYAPGSTMKVVTAAAALDSGDFSAQTAISSPSPVEISGVPLQNFGNQSFGAVDMTTALTQSVNTYFAQLAVDLGGETLFEYMDRFGFNRDPELDYPDEQMIASGIFERGRLVTDPDRIDVGRMAIGQERLRVTPLQMAEVAAAVANEGELMRPTFVQSVRDADGRETQGLRGRRQSQAISSESAEELKQMMAGVVREGTGTQAALAGIDVAGKTGTAEGGGGGDVNQPWFIGFAPVDDPQIAVAVTVEAVPGGFGGTTAAPIAAAVMRQLIGSGS